MVNYVHPSRRPSCAPSLEDIVESRFAELQAQGYGIARTATALALDTLPYEAEPLPTERLGWRAYVGVLLALCALAGVLLAFPPASHTAPVQGAPDTTCYEDMPCFNWAQDGNGARGVILKGAPKRCTWQGRGTGCIVVLGVCEYAQARKARTIDHKRTPSLKGDGWARDHGCDVLTADA